MTQSSRDLRGGTDFAGRTFIMARAGLSVSIERSVGTGEKRRRLEDWIGECVDDVREQTGSGERFRVAVFTLRPGLSLIHRVRVEIDGANGAVVEEADLDPFLAARHAFRRMKRRCVSRMHAALE